MFWAYKDRPLSELPEACKEYASKARKEIKDKKGIAEQDALLIRVEPKHPAPAVGGPVSLTFRFLTDGRTIGKTTGGRHGIRIG